MTNFFNKNLLNIFVWFLIILNVLPILAPIAAYFGLDIIAKPIYFLYSFSCHQFHWRSIHFFDYQVAWCTRDMFIWGSFLITSLAIKFEFIKKGLNWYWVVPLIIPIALDGGIQTIATLVGFTNDSQFYLSTNFIRMITGSIFGIALGAIMTPIIKEEQEKLNNIHY